MRDGLTISIDKVKIFENQILNSTFSLDTFQRLNLTIPESTDLPIIIRIKVPKNTGMAFIDENSVLLDKDKAITINQINIINIKGKEYIKIEAEIYNSIDFKNDVESAIKWGSDNYLDWSNNLSQNEKLVLSEFISDGFKDINSYLERTGSTKNIDVTLNEKVKIVQDTLKIIPNNITVYYRINPDKFGINDSLKQDFNDKNNVDEFIKNWEGKVFNYISFLNGSLLSSNDGDNQTEKIVIRLNIPKGSKGAFISILNNKGTNFLLPHNSDLKINRITTFEDISNEGGGSIDNPATKLLIDALLIPKPELKKIQERILDEDKDKELIERVQQLKSLLPTKIKKTYNFAHANANIEGLSKNEYFSHSKIQSLKDISNKMYENIKDISVKPDIQEFATLSVDRNDVVGTETAWNRNSDTESKIMEEINIRLEKNINAKGTINLFTEMYPCASCKYVIDQFREKYKNIEVNVIYKTIYKTK